MSTSAITEYYDFAKLFSFNATWNGVCGGRGMGKTWGSKRKTIKDALKAIKFKTYEKEVNARGRNTKKMIEITEVDSVDNQFVYLRSYKEELSIAKETFFADIEHLWPDWDFRINGWKAEASPTKFAEMKSRPWAIIGFFVSLSVASNFKSAQFPKVNWIIFDEFIIEKGGQYLPNEPTKLVNFSSTVSRYRPNVRVLMLANAVNITNPYFIHYNVDPDKADENKFIFQVKRITGGYQMLWHFPVSEAFEAEIAATDFGQFILETDPEYADYAVRNQFNDNHKSMIGKKPKTATYVYTVETQNGIFSVWYDTKTNFFYCQEKRPANDEDFVTLVEEWMSEGKRLATFQDKTMGMLRSAYRHDRMRFDLASTRNAFIPVFKR
jgi:hypothetical protein